jgi:hypothetical protein
MLEGVNYLDAVLESPSQAEICFAIFADVLEVDGQGDPVNEKHAERRPATWLCPGKPQLVVGSGRAGLAEDEPLPPCAAACPEAAVTTARTLE